MSPSTASVDRGSMEGTVAVVTGGNSGIGRETAAGLASRGATTVLACRNPERGEDAAESIRSRTGNPEVAVVAMDLLDLDTVERAAGELVERFGVVDVLVNNAGGMWDTRATSPQGLERCFVVNYLGHYLLTRLLLKKLGDARPRRIVNVSSAGHRQGGIHWDDLQGQQGWWAPQAYGQAKLAQILFTRELARRYGDRGVVAHSVHPGVVRTGFGGSDDLHGAMRLITRGLLACAGRSATSGAKTSIFLATSERAAGSNGGYWVRCKRRLPSRAARDDQAARRLWEVSEELVLHTGLRL